MAIHVRERLLRKAKRQGECLIWEGAASADGTKKCRKCQYKRTAEWVKKDRQSRRV